MRTATDILLPVLAEGEPSRVPFYVVGGLLAGWAVVLSAIGLTQPDFPGSGVRARAVMAISGVLVLATATSAIATSSKHSGEHPQGGEEHGRPSGHAGAPTPEKAPAPSGPGEATVRIAADSSGQLEYEQTSVTARAGAVTIEFDNPAPVPHDVTVERGGRKLGATRVVTEGSATAQLDLRPGVYTFYCSVDGHRQAGMQGQLTAS